jgi:hypothetical protein
MLAAAEWRGRENHTTLGDCKRACFECQPEDIEGAVRKAPTWHGYLVSCLNVSGDFALNQPGHCGNELFDSVNALLKCRSFLGV